jgi:hypothetical protein
MPTLLNMLKARLLELGMSLLLQGLLVMILARRLEYISSVIEAAYQRQSKSQQG